jgi:hypothetical protein
LREKSVALQSSEGGSGGVMSEVDATGGAGRGRVSTGAGADLGGGRGAERVKPSEEEEGVRAQEDG